jgi:hypothetical protein
MLVSWFRISRGRAKLFLLLGNVGQWFLRVSCYGSVFGAIPLFSTIKEGVTDERPKGKGDSEIHVSVLDICHDVTYLNRRNLILHGIRVGQKVDLSPPNSSCHKYTLQIRT